MNAGTYPLGEGLTLVVTSAGAFSVDGATVERPNEEQVRAEVKARYGFAVTLGKWRLENTLWRCPVISKLKVVSAKPRLA